MSDLCDTCGAETERLGSAWVCSECSGLAGLRSECGSLGQQLAACREALRDTGQQLTEVTDVALWLLDRAPEETRAYLRSHEYLWLKDYWKKDG